MISLAAATTLSDVFETLADLHIKLAFALARADVISAHTFGDARALWELRRTLELSILTMHDLHIAFLNLKESN